MIYYDINDSEYYLIYDNLTFFFSSRLYLEKFKNRHLEYLKNENNKLNIRYKSNCCFDKLLLICLYKQIEKRGFKILYNDKPLASNSFMNVDIIF